MKGLKDKVVVLTGASSGIGRAAALQFVEEGAKVIGVARRENLLMEVKAEAEKMGGVFIPYCGDLTDDATIDGMIDTAIEKFGRIDILINNAGRADALYPVHLVDDKRWEYILNLMLTAPMKAMRKAIPYMMEQGGGNIVNVASVGAWRVVAGAAYVAAKAGLLAITRNAAYMYADKNIRVNAVCPGGVDTACAYSYPDDPNNEFGLAFTTKVCGSMVRLAQPQETARAILLLASDEAPILNGIAVAADNGFMAG